MTTAGRYRQTVHWYVAVADDDLNIHLVLTPVAAKKVADLACLTLHEREDLFEAIRSEVADRGIQRYEVLARCWPGTQLEVHVMSRPEGSCPGVPLARPAAAEVGMLLDLARSVQCPLCGANAKQWFIKGGAIGHYPDGTAPGEQPGPKTPPAPKRRRRGHDPGHDPGE